MWFTNYLVFLFLIYSLLSAYSLYRYQVPSSIKCSKVSFCQHKNNLMNVSGDWENHHTANKYDKSILLLCEIIIILVTSIT